MRVPKSAERPTTVLLPAGCEIRHLQAVVNIDSKSTVAIGSRVSTRDFAWFVYLSFQGDSDTRKALKPVLLRKPELAAALSVDTWERMIDVLTNSTSAGTNHRILQRSRK